MVSDAVRNAHTKLVYCNWEIRKQFAAMDDDSIDHVLGPWQSTEELRDGIREHGDGYTLRSVPSGVEQMRGDADLVLIVGRFPLLKADSVFDPNASLAQIPYWRDGKGLRESVAAEDGLVRRFQFLIWQRMCPVHGHSLEMAQESRRFLNGRFPALGELMETQAREAEQLIYLWLNWLRTRNPPRSLLVVTDAFTYSPDTQIEKFLATTELHLVTRLWGSRSGLMDRIVKRLA